MPGRTILLLAVALALAASRGSASADARGDLAAAEAREAAGSWAAAESLATAALAAFERDPAPDSLAIARAGHVLASSRSERQIAGDTLARRVAERSLAIRERAAGADPLDLAASHLLLSRLFRDAGRPDSALAHAQLALAIRSARPPANDTLLAEAWRNLGGCQYDARDPRGASESLERAIAIQEHLPGAERARADALAMLGLVLTRLDRPDAAKAKEREALDLLDRTYGPGEKTRWNPLNKLATMELADGNPAVALELERQAFEIARLALGEDASPTLSIRFNEQLCLQQLGDHAGAKQICDELLPRFVKRYGPEHPNTLGLRQSRAFANERLDRDADALAEFREIEAAFARAGGPLNPNHVLAWREIAYLTRRQGRLAEARAACDHALALEASSPRPIGWSLLSLEMMKVSVLEAIGDRPALDSAGVELDALATRYRLGSLLDRANVEHWRSRIDRACGRPESAWTRALASEELARRRVRCNLEIAPDRHALLLAQRSALYLDLVLDLARGEPQRADSAWDRLVRDRGQGASEMARRRLPRAARADTALAAAHARWIAAQRRYAARLVQSPPRDSTARAELDRLRTAAEDAEQDVAARLGGRGALPADDPGLADVRARLAPDAVLVAFAESHAGDDTARVLAFVAGREGPVRTIDLGPSSALAAAVDPWLAALAAPPRGRAPVAEARCRELGRRVRALTWDRLAPLTGPAHEMFVVGDGPLLDLPWAALPEGEHGYLLETAPHLHRLLAERDLPAGPTAPRAGSLLAIGAPDFARGLPGGSDPDPPLAVALRSAPCAAASFPPLPGSAAEVREVARAWRAAGAPAEVLLGAAADEAAFKRAAAGHAVLHLATHGFVLRDSCPAAAAGTRGVGGVELLAARHTRRARALKAPAAPVTPARPAPSRLEDAQRVWLAFAGADRAREHHGDENEGLLTAEEVVTLDLEGTDWVVLSACHSAAAEDWRREGTRGMGDAFHFAGARSVIASRWAIADDATSEWMTGLYAARAQGVGSAALAVESASRAVLAARRASGRSTHPFYWAAFGASGE